MGFFDFFRSPDIDEGIAQYKSTNNAVLLDVRTKEEYAEGHIEDSVNVPLDSVMSVESVVKDKNTPLFVYCFSGSRSGQAVSILKRMGYNDVTNIGGICNYSGKAVK